MGKDTGLNSAGTFHLICRECDSSSANSVWHSGDNASAGMFVVGIFFFLKSFENRPISVPSQSNNQIRLV